MKAVKRALLWMLTAVTMFGTMTVPAQAASRKKITTVKVNVKSQIQPEMRFGEEEIDVEIGGKKHYSFSHYEIENFGFEWFEDDIPDITIYLTADEGYYFALSKASAISLSGATYVKATRQDSSETLALEVKLPSLKEQVADMSPVELVDLGYAYWEPVRGAGSYEMRLYRNGTAIGATLLSTTETQYNFQSMMNRPGTYNVKMRACNSIRPENVSEWVESNPVTVTEESVKLIKEGVEPERPIRGKWMYDNTGGWWYMFEDGSYPQNTWYQIDDCWYFFDETGYLHTGWLTWDGKEYYLDDKTGKMLTNTTTPDGYILDANGNKKTGW